MLRALGGFGAFGLFWGAWGAILPAVKSEAGVNDGQLGSALLMVGILCALAFVVENAWQSWGAVHLDSTYNAAPALASSAPAVFAAAAAGGRISGNALLKRVHPADCCWWEAL